MSERVIHVTTPQARKEHFCAICGLPISKGERYLNIAYKKGGKMLNRKTHFGCKEQPEEKPKVAAIPGVPVTEEQFKQQVHDDTMRMIETFTFEKNINIAFVPLVITEVAWYFGIQGC